MALDTDVVWPDYLEKMDYELKLVAVVGKRGCDINVEETDQYSRIRSSTTSTRATRSSARWRRTSVRQGKNFANGLGPYLTTADALDVSEVEMTARVNSDSWSEGIPGTMHHTFTNIVAHVSTSEIIYPGEVIGSGIVDRGCGLELGELLSDGDTVELKIEGIRTLRHRIVRSA